MHAVRDAEYVLYCSQMESSSTSTLAWSSTEADFCIPGAFKECRCFWYDVKEDRCFSVKSDDILTPKQETLFVLSAFQVSLPNIQAFLYPLLICFIVIVDTEIFRGVAFLSLSLLYLERGEK